MAAHVTLLARSLSLRGRACLCPKDESAGEGLWCVCAREKVWARLGASYSQVARQAARSARRQYQRSKSMCVFVSRTTTSPRIPCAGFTRLIMYCLALPPLLLAPSRAWRAHTCSAKASAVSAARDRPVGSLMISSMRPAIAARRRRAPKVSSRKALALSSLSASRQAEDRVKVTQK